MKLSIFKGFSRLMGSSDTVGTSAGAADAGKVPHLDSTGLLSGTMTMVFPFAGVPVDGASGTLFGVIPPGALLLDTTNHNIYINVNTKASPTYKLVTRAA